MSSEEVWKDIPGYEGLYCVSNIGRIMSLDFNHTKVPKIRILRKDRAGYIVVNLHKNNRVKTLKVHRIVAISFIPNPLGLPHINHKDEDKSNNCVDNLEWCDTSYNNCYGSRIRRALDTKKKNGSCKAERAVVKIDRNGTILEEFQSISDAARKIGVKRESVRDCVLGRQKTCVGYIWKYK